MGGQNCFWPTTPTFDYKNIILKFLSMAMGRVLTTIHQIIMEIAFVHHVPCLPIHIPDYYQDNGKYHCVQSPFPMSNTNHCCWFCFTSASASRLYLYTLQWKLFPLTVLPEECACTTFNLRSPNGTKGPFYSH